MRKKINHFCPFQADLMRAFSSWRFYFSILAGFLFFSRQLFMRYSHWQFLTPMEMLSIPLAISDFTPFAVVFCAFPFSDSFCHDYSTKYLFFISSRIDIRRYARCRCAAVAACGGVVMASIIILTINICVIGAGKSETVESLLFLQGTIWGKMGVLYVCGGVFHYLGRVFLAFLFGAVWALAALTISVFVTNPYVTVLSPFVVYQVLWFLLEGLPINPVYLLRADYGGIPSFSFVVIVQCLCILFCSVVACWGIKRKVLV